MSNWHVVLSPPFAETVATADRKWIDEKKRPGSGGPFSGDEIYSFDRNNVGTLAVKRVEHDPNAHLDYLAGVHDKDVWVITEGKSRKQYPYYSDESFRHPAKMPPALASAILTAYTKPGDTVLDPMAGIGTTVCEAIRLGRNAVGVEYEQKFVRMANDNLRLLRARGGGNGLTAEIVHGDSRDLPGALKGLARTAAPVSPPYPSGGPASPIVRRTRVSRQIRS